MAITMQILCFMLIAGYFEEGWVCEEIKSSGFWRFNLPHAAILGSDFFLSEVIGKLWFHVLAVKDLRNEVEL